MPAEPEDRQALHPGGFVAIFLATLQLAAPRHAYVCGLLSMAYMAWVVPGVCGVLVRRRAPATQADVWTPLRRFLSRIDGMSASVRGTTGSYPSE